MHSLDELTARTLPCLLPGRHCGATKWTNLPLVDNPGTTTDTERYHFNNLEVILP